MEGQAEFIAEWEAFGGWESSLKYFDAIIAMDAAAVHDAMAQHIDPDQASLVAYHSRAHPVFEASADEVRTRLDAEVRAYAVEPGRAPASVTLPRSAGAVELEQRVGSVSVFRTASGLPILVRRRPGAPIVHLGLYSSGGAASEPADLAGIGTLMMRSSVKGTTSRNADAIAGESEMLGGTIGTSVATDGGGWTFSVPSPRWRDAVDLLRDVVLHPVFAADVIETERAIALSQLSQMRDDMVRYPVRLSLEAAWEGHPYSRTTLGTEESLRSLTSDSVVQWHESTVLSSATVAAAVGDVPEEELAQAMADAFSGIRHAPALRTPAPTWPTGMRQRIEERDKAQTAIAIGFPGPTRLDPNRYAVGTLMLIASGLGGRFFDELRDKRSLAYTVQAWATERVSAGMFTAYIATAPSREEEAREGLLAEFTKLREFPVTPEELSRATRYALGTHAISQQSGGTVLAELLDAWLFGEGLSELDEFEARISAVTARDIQEFAVRSLDPESRVEGIVRGR
jgi:zinc protease